MTSRQYIKRVWRVPKDRGASTYFAALLAKLLTKHGWPSEVEPDAFGVMVRHKFRDDLPSDFDEAVTIACRILARTYRLELTYENGYAEFQHPYEVTSGGFFRKAPSYDLSREG